MHGPADDGQVVVHPQHVHPVTRGPFTISVQNWFVCSIFICLLPLQIWFGIEKQR